MRREHVLIHKIILHRVAEYIQNKSGCQNRLLTAVLTVIFTGELIREKVRILFHKTVFGQILLISS